MLTEKEAEEHIYVKPTTDVDDIAKLFREDCEKLHDDDSACGPFDRCS